jgi:hypothetical protein
VRSLNRSFTSLKFVVAYEREKHNRSQNNQQE